MDPLVEYGPTAEVDDGTVMAPAASEARYTAVLATSRNRAGGRRGHEHYYSRTLGCHMPWR